MDSRRKTHANWQMCKEEERERPQWERECKKEGAAYDNLRLLVAHPRLGREISLSLHLFLPLRLSGSSVDLLACPDIRRRSDRAAASYRQRRRRETWLAGGVYNVAAARAQSGSSYVAQILYANIDCSRSIVSINRSHSRFCTCSYAVLNYGIFLYRYSLVNFQHCY